MTINIRLADLTPEEREHFEERAAIREFEGNESREDAERAALAEVLDRRRKNL